MIPNYQVFMRPLLEAANKEAGIEVKLSDMIVLLSDRFHLTDIQRKELLPSGNQTVIANRVGWAKTYLAKAGLLETKSRGYFNITERGKTAIKDPTTIIDNQFLKTFDEFILFKGRKNKDLKEIEPKATTSDEITPDETLFSAYEQINSLLTSDLLERVRKVDPSFFEQLLIELLLAMGYGDSNTAMAHSLGGSGDNGVDGVVNQDPLGTDQIYIQAKRYAAGNNISSAQIREFFGALNQKKAQKGIFVTTSDFTQSAKNTAKDLGMRIVLVDGIKLATLMLRYNIGCREEKTLVIKKIDEEFFDR